MSWVDRSTTTWRKEILIVMEENKDLDINNYVCTLTEEELDIEFDDSYGMTNGLPFTLWTTWWVYFPLCYDGSEFCGSVSRNPTKIPTRHQGG
jgi:hypothetical protein